MDYTSRERIFLEMLEVTARKYESILQAVSLEDAKKHAVDGIKSIDGLFQLIHDKKNNSLD